MKRVFIGMPPDGGLLQAADAFRRSHTEIVARWILRHNLHLTLVPPWGCRDIGAACSALRAIACLHAPVDVRFDEVSPGPDRRRPRLVWATGVAPAPMLSLFNDLAVQFGSGEARAREFLLHLTIARFRSGSSVPQGFREAVAWEGRFDALCLYESILRPEGADYAVLCRCPLSGPAVPPIGVFKN